MKKLRLILLPLIALSLHSSCEKTRPTVWMKYAETQCSDPWHASMTQADETEEKVKEFFKNEGVNIMEIEIEKSDSNNPITCFACHCASFRTIKCKVKEKDAETMEAFGFETP